MDETDNADVFLLVDYLKHEKVIAAAIVMVKLAKREGISSVQYTKQVQEQYIKENHDKINPMLEQQFLASCQDEVLEKLRKAIPVADHQCITRKNSEELVVGGGSLDWIDGPHVPNKTRVQDDTYESAPIIRPKAVFSSKECAQKNIQFVESVMRIHDESSRNTPIPTSCLQSLLYDEGRFVNHLQYKKVSADENSSRPNHFSDDSGIGYSENLSEDNCSVKFVSSSVVRYALQSADTNNAVMHSVMSAISFLKNEVKVNPAEVFLSWKGSLVEYVCEVISKCACSNNNCKELLMDFIIDQMEEIWNDNRPGQHRQWEMKIAIYNEFLANCDICYEVLEYISENLKSFMTAIVSKDNRAPLMVEKLYFLLNLYSSICGTIKKLQSMNGGKENSANTNAEDDVTKMWQKWCPKTADREEEDLKKMVDQHIQVLERLVISVTNRRPLLAILAVEALKGARQLYEPNTLTQESCS